MSGRQNIGRWTLYIGCLVAALGALGYYWFEYIPRQREYFLNLRFRALAVIGDQFRGKVGGLGASMGHATRPGVARTPSEYISIMVPDLALKCGEPASGGPGPGVDFDTVRFEAGNCRATAAISKILSRSVDDDLFDDVLIADHDGRVLYERAPSSPRIVSLAALWKSPGDGKSAPVEANGTDADAVHSIRLDGSGYLLMTQPLSVPALGASGNLVLAGLARSERLEAEARHVAPQYLILLFAPLVIVLLSGPFLKILLLRRTGRIVFRDMVLLALFTMIAAGIGTILLLSWHDYGLAGARVAPRLDRFANSFEDAIVTDLQVMRNTLDVFDRALPENVASLAERDRHRADLWTSQLPRFDQPFLPLDFVFWTNADACQAVKWTTKVINTPQVPQTEEEHFQNILAGKLTTLDLPNSLPFTLQARISPTTSQMIVVMAAPTSRAIAVSGCSNPNPSPLVSVAMVAPIPSLASPVVPPRAGFAIFDPSGKVIFHSVPERNLHENLFEEMQNPDPWRAATAMRAERSASAYYRARKYEFHMRPFRRISGTSWSLATFRETEPEQAIVGLIWSETLTWFLALLAALTACFALASVIVAAKSHVTWRRQLEFVLGRIWPHRDRKPLYASISRSLALLSAVAIVSLTLVTGRVLDWAGLLVVLCLACPAAAIALITTRLWKAPPVSDAGGPIAPSTQPAYIACLALCVVLIAVVPVAGMFRLVQAFETRIQLMHWQQELVNRIDTRESRLAAWIRGARSYSGAAKVFLLSKQAEWEGPQGWWARPPYLSAFWSTKIESFPTRAELGAAWWEKLLSDTRPEAHTDAVESGVLARSRSHPGACRWFEGAQGDVALRCEPRGRAPIQIGSAIPSPGTPASVVWWLASAALLGCAYAWYCLAFRRLFALDMRYTPLPRLGDLAPADVESHLLVLGLPLARKDEAVRNWLTYTPPRVNLYTERFHPFWLEDTLSRLETELGGAKALAATAGGGASVTVATHRPWVHISNLEAKLRDAGDRRVVIALLDKLLTMDAQGSRVRVIVTSSIDPVFHFDSVFERRQQTLVENPLPEHESQRLARILHNFRKVQPGAQEPAKAEPAAQDVVSVECGFHQALLSIAREATAPGPGGAPIRDPMPVIGERAQALYKLFWASCTRSEKLLLIHLAQSGFVNPLCCQTLEVLMRKGLVKPQPRPQIANETFRRFVTTVEPPDTVREWEGEAGESSWPMIRNLAIALSIVGLAVMALTQTQAVQTITAVVTGVGAALGGVLKLAGMFGTRRESSAPSPQG